VSWRLDIRPAALADIEGEAAWYEERQQGQARRLQERFDVQSRDLAKIR